MYICTQQTQGLTLKQLTTMTNVIEKFVDFCNNYPHDFIKKCWDVNPRIADHLESKFTGFYERYGSMGAMNAFYNSLDNENRELLTQFILNS